MTKWPVHNKHTEQYSNNTCMVYVKFNKRAYITIYFGIVCQPRAHNSVVTFSSFLESWTVCWFGLNIEFWSCAKVVSMGCHVSYQ